MYVMGDLIVSDVFLVHMTPDLHKVSYHTLRPSLHFVNIIRDNITVKILSVFSPSDIISSLSDIILKAVYNQSANVYANRWPNKF